jgi:hypothetical protein
VLQDVGIGVIGMIGSDQHRLALFDKEFNLVDAATGDAPHPI